MDRDSKIPPIELNLLATITIYISELHLKKNNFPDAFRSYWHAFLTINKTQNADKKTIEMLISLGYTIREKLRETNNTNISNILLILHKIIIFNLINLSRLHIADNSWENAFNAFKEALDVKNEISNQNILKEINDKINSLILYFCQVNKQQLHPYNTQPPQDHSEIEKCLLRTIQWISQDPYQLNATKDEIPVAQCRLVEIYFLNNNFDKVIEICPQAIIGMRQKLTNETANSPKFIDDLVLLAESSCYLAIAHIKTKSGENTILDTCKEALERMRINDMSDRDRQRLIKHEDNIRKHILKIAVRKNKKGLNQVGPQRLSYFEIAIRWITSIPGIVTDRENQALAAIQYNLGHTQFRKGNLELAHIDCKSAISTIEGIREKSNSDYYTMAKAHYILAAIHLKKNKLDNEILVEMGTRCLEALKNLKIIVSNNTPNPDRFHLTLSTLQSLIKNIYLKLGAQEKAAKYSKFSFDNMQKISKKNAFVLKNIQNSSISASASLKSGDCAQPNVNSENIDSIMEEIQNDWIKATISVQYDALFWNYGQRNSSANRNSMFSTNILDHQSDEKQTETFHLILPDPAGFREGSPSKRQKIR